MAAYPQPPAAAAAEDYRPPDPTRTTWPELVGYPDFHAGLLICYDRPDVHVQFFDVGLTQPAGTDQERAVVYRAAGTDVVAYPPYLG